jgi:hypothetical protein
VEEQSWNRVAELIHSQDPDFEELTDALGEVRKHIPDYKRVFFDMVVLAFMALLNAQIKNEIEVVKGKQKVITPRNTEEIKTMSINTGKLMAYMRLGSTMMESMVKITDNQDAFYNHMFENFVKEELKREQKGKKEPSE